VSSGCTGPGEKKKDVLIALGGDGSTVPLHSQERKGGGVNQPSKCVRLKEGRKEAPSVDLLSGVTYLKRKKKSAPMGSREYLPKGEKLFERVKKVSQGVLLRKGTSEDRCRRGAKKGRLGQHFILRQKGEGCHSRHCEGATGALRVSLCLSGRRRGREHL